MKYIRIVVGVEEEDVEGFDLELDEFIEENDHVQGAYIAGLYDSREEAWGVDWKEFRRS